MTDDQLAGVLRQCSLSYLLERFSWDTVVPWEDVLSVGEQQRLAFARLFYHQPSYAVMDEATSALDEPLQAHCLRECVRLGITMVSVAHRTTVAPFHTTILRFSDDLDGTYTLESVREGEEGEESDGAETRAEDTLVV
jgi:ABC-type uncharacterized transport system fused permease/ATPase subunit